MWASNAIVEVRRMKAFSGGWSELQPLLDSTETHPGLTHRTSATREYETIKTWLRKIPTALKYFKGARLEVVNRWCAYQVDAAGGVPAALGGHVSGGASSSMPSLSRDFWMRLGAGKELSMQALIEQSYSIRPAARPGAQLVCVFPRSSSPRVVICHKPFTSITLEKSQA